MRRVLITGGTGFLGRHLARRMLIDRGPASACSTIVIFSRGEHRQAEMREEFSESRLRFFIGDVRDLERLRLAMRGVDTVVHAAALKRVDTCEYDPFEAVKTNVIGTANVAQAAMEAGVGHALLISSDKASAPLNVYGKTKACAEGVWLAAGAYAPSTKFAAVRYGNVAGSTGSVVPRWLDLARQGKALPVTNPDATRFWFTVDGAVDLVLDTLRTMRGGELVVPMLPAFRVGDLAEAMAEDRWRAEPPRAGDKAHECMISEDEAPEFFLSGKGTFQRGGLSTGVPLPWTNYRSDTTTQRLDVSSLRKELERL